MDTRNLVEKEIESYEKAINIDAKNTIALFKLGFAYYKIGNHKKAIESYKKVAEIDKKNTKAWYNMGYSYNELGNHEKEIESYEKAVKIDPNNESAWYNLGNAFRKSGDHRNAIESYKEAVKINQKFDQAWNNMGFTYSKIGNFEKEIESYKKALEIEPNDIKAWNNIAIAYEEIGNLEKAKESFEKTILIDKFRFIREDVFLCPQVNLITGNQNLTMYKINLATNEVKFEDSIDCIHTAVTEISPRDYEDYQNDKDIQEQLYKTTLQIRSSEELKEINLTPEEKFNALKSWTAGIAEAGMNAFLIQDEIDKNLDLLYPIMHFLMRFMVKADRDFLPEFITKIERECMFEGIRHESSFIANTIPILEMVWANYLKNKMIESEDIETVKTLLALDNSGKIFKTDANFLILLKLADPEYAKFIMIPEDNVKTHDK